MFLEVLLHILIRLITPRQPIQQISHNGSIRLEFELVQLLVDLQHHFEVAVLVAGVHEQFEQLQVQFDLLEIDPSEHFDHLSHPERLLDLVLVLQHADPHQDPAHVHVHLPVHLLEL